MTLSRSFLIFGLSLFLGRGIALLVSPLTTRLLTPEQFQAIPLLAAVWAVIALVRHGGMDWAFPFFRAGTRHEDERRRILATASLVGVVSAAGVWAAFAAAGLAHPWLRRYAGVSTTELALYLAGLAPMILKDWHMYVLRFEHAIWPFARLNLMGTVAGTVVAVPLLFLFPQEQRLVVLLAALAGAEALATGWSLLELKWAGKWPYRLDDFCASLSKRMLRHGLVLVPGGMVYALLSIADRHLVRWLAPNEVHTLVLAVSFGSAVFMLKGLIGLVWDPRMVDWIATRDPARYEPKLQHGAALFGGTLLSLAGLAAVWSDWVVDLLYPGTYGSAAALIPVLAMAGALSAFSLVGVATALVANLPRFHLPVYALGLLVNVVIGVVAIPRLGALGAALGTLGAEAFIICAWVFIGRILLRNLKIRWRLPLLMTAVVALAVAFYRPGMVLPGLVLLERLLASAALLAVMGALLWWGGPAEGWRAAFAENGEGS